MFDCSKSIGPGDAEVPTQRAAYPIPGGVVAVGTSAARKAALIADAGRRHAVVPMQPIQNTHANSGPSALLPPAAEGAQ